MLEAPAADQLTVIHRGLHLVSFLCCALVLASFAMFAFDQVSGASEHQVAQIASGAPTSPGVTPRSTHHSSLRRFIDNAAHALTSPFRSILQTSSEWAKEIFETVCAILVYGLGLGYLTRYSRGFS
jgi:hypothetical protein